MIPKQATHYNQKHDEYWMLDNGIYHLYVNGYWHVARPKFDGMVEL